MQKIKSEAKLTFGEAMSIIIGHGVGSGILSIPYLASRNSLSSLFITMAVVYIINLLLHFMIAELSLNNGGAQFIKCFEAEFFTGKLQKIIHMACVCTAWLFGACERQRLHHRRGRCAFGVAWDFRYRRKAAFLRCCRVSCVRRNEACRAL